MAQKYIAYIFRSLFIVIATILFVDSCLSGFSRPLFVTYSIGIITCNLYCLWRVRKNVNLLIVFSLILFFNYSITIANYLVHFDNNSFVSPIDSFYSIKSLNLLFSILLCIFLQFYCATFSNFAVQLFAILLCKF